MGKRCCLNLTEFAENAVYNKDSVRTLKCSVDTGSSLERKKITW